MHYFILSLFYFFTILFFHYFIFSLFFSPIGERRTIVCEYFKVVQIFISDIDRSIKIKCVQAYIVFNLRHTFYNLHYWTFHFSSFKSTLLKTVKINFHNVQHFFFNWEKHVYKLCFFIIGHFWSSSKKPFSLIKKLWISCLLF
jgi:hypothetical protein